MSTHAMDASDGDWVTLASDLTPQEAQILVGFLQAAGIEAAAADLQLVQTHALLSIAVGGVRVRVRAQRLDEARELRHALRQGRFELDDDFEPPVG